MSAPDVIRALEGQGYRDFRVKALDAQARVVKLYVDGATGHILAQRERFPGLNDDD